MTYRSPYEAYPFLCDASNDLRCDFEIMTDKMASLIGLLRSKVEDEALRAELLWLCETVYHMNPTLRTRFTVTDDELDRLYGMVELRQACRKGCGSPFVLTQGCEQACIAHVLRVMGKELVRLIYRHIENGGSAPDKLIDMANALSGYFFVLALDLNAAYGVDEIPYESRNYGVKSS